MSDAEFSIGIVAHTDRQHGLHQSLVCQVAPCLSSIDNGGLGATGNHARVQSLLLEHAGWSVVLEDDALPLYDFRATLQQVLTLAPTKVVSLYLGTGYPRNWQRRIAEVVTTDASFILCPELLHAVGYAIHPSIKAELCEWMNSPKSRGVAPDTLISMWLRTKGLQVAYTNPSLVDHADLGTVIKMRTGNFNPGRNLPRHAHNTSHRLTWTANAVTLNR